MYTLPKAGIQQISFIHHNSLFQQSYHSLAHGYKSMYWNSTQTVLYISKLLKLHWYNG